MHLKEFRDAVKALHKAGIDVPEGCNLARHEAQLLNCPGWDDTRAKALGFTLAGFDDDPDIHVMMNMHWGALALSPARRWRAPVNRTG
jgi:isoamylase